MAHDNTVRTILNDLGFGNAESDVYEYGATQSTALSVRELQRQTSLKRPTIYYALEQLCDKGLVSRVTTDGKTNYLFRPPTELEHLVQDEVRQAKSKLHNVAKLIDLLPTEANDGKLQVSHFDGLQGIKTVVDMTLYCKSREWMVIAPFKNFLRDYDEKYSRYYVHTKRSRGIKTKTLWEKVMPTSRVLSANEVKEKNPRIMPSSMEGKFESIVIIFDNKVAIIGPYSHMSAIVIESQEVCGMMSGLFDIVWEVSTPYKAAAKALKE